GQQLAHDDIQIVKFAQSLDGAVRGENLLNQCGPGARHSNDEDWRMRITAPISSVAKEAFREKRFGILSKGSQSLRIEIAAEAPQGIAFRKILEGPRMELLVGIGFAES